MAELIGFLILFGALALVIGSLATGTVRIIAFSVLTALAMYIGFPTIQAQLTGLFQGAPGAATGGFGNFPSIGSPLALIPFVIVFGAIATVVGTLLKGAQRNIGYGVLAFLALISLGGPLRDQVASIPGVLFNSTPSTSDVPAQQVPSNTGDPNQFPADSGNIPANNPTGTGTTGTGQPGTIRPADPTGNRPARRPGLPALW